MRKGLLVFLEILPCGADQALGIQKYAMLPSLQKRQCPAVSLHCNQVPHNQQPVGTLSAHSKHAATAADIAGVQSPDQEPMALRPELPPCCGRTSCIDKPCIRCSAMAIISPMPVPASPAP